MSEQTRINVHWVQVDDTSRHLPLSVLDGLNATIAASVPHLYGPYRHMFAVVCDSAVVSTLKQRLDAIPDVAGYLCLEELPQ